MEKITKILQIVIIAALAVAVIYLFIDRGSLHKEINTLIETQQEVLRIEITQRDSMIAEANITISTHQDSIVVLQHKIDSLLKVKRRTKIRYRSLIIDGKQKINNVRYWSDDKVVRYLENYRFEIKN